MQHERSPLGARPLTVTLSLGVAAAAVMACSSGNGSTAQPPVGDGGLEAGVSTLFSAADMRDATKCGECHTDHYKDWAGSMHAYASDDPVFIAMNKRGQRETGGQLGTFCVNCHAPMAVRDGLTPDGLNLDTLNPTEKGVTCYFCHSITAVQGTHDAQLGIANDLVMRGPFADPVANRAHNAMSGGELFDNHSPVSSTACGTCHDIVNGHGTDIERTFQEWTASLYSQAGTVGRSCLASGCHMDESSTPRPISIEPANVKARLFHSHTFGAVDSVLVPNFPAQGTADAAAAQASEIQTSLSDALGKALCVKQQPNGKYEYRVVVDNLGAGHNFPSGSSQDRRVWAEIVAYQNNQIVYSTGTIAAGDLVTASKDPDLWLIRDCMYGDVAKTQQVSMFWNAASFESNTLPAPVTNVRTDIRYYNTHVLQTFPRTGVAAASPLPDRVTLQVHMQPIGLDVIDDLITSGDLDPSYRTKMPTLDVGAMLVWTADAAKTITFNDPVDHIPIACVSDGSFDPSAGSVTAVKNANCSP